MFGRHGNNVQIKMKSVLVCMSIDLSRNCESMSFFLR